MNGLSICAVICAAAVILSLPYYCKITFPGKNRKTLILKMFQSLMFVIASILTSAANEGFFLFNAFLIVGFCLSAVGDYFLGKGEGSKLFLIGAAFFLSAHVMYITGFSLSAKMLFPDVGWFNVIEVSVYCALLSALVLLCMARNPRFHKLIIPMIVYFSVLCLMVTKAFGLGIRLMTAGEYGAVILPVGAFLFLCSDTTLSMMRYKMAKRTFFLRSFSSCTYFTGQLLMALSVLFIIN